VNYCIAEAVYFGDLEDDSSSVSQLLKKNRVFRLKENLGTQPSVYYILNDETDSESSSERVDLCAAKKHNTWKEVVAVNFILAGAGAGSYITGYYLNQISQQIPESDTTAGAIASVLLLIIGFACAWVGEERHSSAVHSLKNIASSWISREILFGLMFIAAAVANLFSAILFFQVVAVLSAMGVLVSQGYILNIPHSVKTWNFPVLPASIFVLGLHSGYGLILIICHGYIESSWFLTAGVLINLLALMFWFLCGKAASHQMQGTAVPIERSSLKTRVITSGYIASVVLLTICDLMHDQYSGVRAYRILSFAAGVAMFAVSALNKAAFVLEMGHEASLVLRVDRCRQNVGPSDRYPVERHNIADARLLMRPSAYFRDKSAQ
jgi:DMSO reductase anchor subunit